LGRAEIKPTICLTPIMGTPVARVFSACLFLGTLLPRANPAACPQLAKADFASSSQHVREGQRIAELEAEIEALRRQAMALGAEPTADVPPWVLLGVKVAARREPLARMPGATRRESRVRGV
jgi:hypothetical protein